MDNTPARHMAPSTLCGLHMGAFTHIADRAPLRRIIAGLMLALIGLSCAQADQGLDLGIEASVTADDNVTRGYGDGNILSDTIAGVNLTKSARYPVSTHTRLSLLVFAGFNSYFEYNGLSQGYAGGQVEFQYRPTASFHSPTYAVSLRTAIENYQSDVRDGYRNAATLSMRKALTDQLQMFGALAYNRREGKSAVFDTSDVALRLSGDFALTRRDSLYLGLEYRHGDFVSTGQPSLDYVDIATAIVLDDAFKDSTRYAYKIDGSTWLLSVGYNRSFGERHALDLSWRMANATPSSVVGASYTSSNIHYTVNQFTLAYLTRF